jgi:hypothetical protein
MAESVEIRALNDGDPETISAAFKGIGGASMWLNIGGIWANSPDMRVLAMSLAKIKSAFAMNNMQIRRVICYMEDNEASRSFGE